MNRLARTAWVTLGWTVAVILWGAFVRATADALWTIVDGRVITGDPLPVQLREPIA